MSKSAGKPVIKKKVGKNKTKEGSTYPNKYTGCLMRNEHILTVDTSEMI